MKRPQIPIGYTFVFRGEHCRVIAIRPWGFRYLTAEGDRNWMHWWFFLATPHWLSKLARRG